MRDTARILKMRSLPCPNPMQDFLSMSDIAVFFKVGGGFKSRMTETTYV
jgi:hypothetical protein